MNNIRLPIFFDKQCCPKLTVVRMKLQSARSAINGRPILKRRFNFLVFLRTSTKRNVISKVTVEQQNSDDTSTQRLPLRYRTSSFTCALKFIRVKVTTFSEPDANERRARIPLKSKQSWKEDFCVNATGIPCRSFCPVESMSHRNTHIQSNCI